ncbi:hypothetical protein ACFL3E_02455 [Patescibacteria group bacterium]
MNKEDLDSIIYPSIKGSVNKDWQNQLEEINELGLDKVAVFVEEFDKKERPHLYKYLSKSCIREVPFVHLRDDTDYRDIEFFVNNYGTKYFNIHEDCFNILDQWKGYWHLLYLEMNTDGVVAKNVEVEKIGGFCIDLAHLKRAIVKGAEEAFYVFSRKNKVKFSCNHLSGYDPITNEDAHLITNLNQFDYLTSLPEFVFGDVIAMEVYNSIKEQLKFKEYIVRLLG